jgi:hypothetical protein
MNFLDNVDSKNSIVGDFMRAPFMELRLLVEDPKLRSKYETYVANHNTKMIENIEFPDAGFDLMTPYLKSSSVGSHHFKCHKVNKLDLGVKCRAFMYDSAGSVTNTGYYMYPRSSISKSCIRLANSVGIIDAGYRGPLIAMVDVVYGDECFVNAYDKMFQICAPNLVPIVAVLVDDLGGDDDKRGRWFWFYYTLEKV